MSYLRGRVLVTGARGFVGTHLLAVLGPAAKPTDADVSNVEGLAGAVRGANPEGVVHLAARSAAGDSWGQAAEVWRVNVVGTVNILDAVRAEAPRARVLIVSTGDAYGDTGGRAAREDDGLAPVSPYAASKAAAEIAAERAARVEGLDVVVARPFPHIGPGQDERFAIGSWTRQIAQLEARGGGVLRVGNLDVGRDLTDVRDVCRAYSLLLDSAVPPGIYNVASGRAVQLRHVVGLLVAMARAPVSVQHDEARLRPADVKVLAGDPTRLRAATGWHSEIPLEDTLADALDHARAALALSEATSQ